MNGLLRLDQWLTHKNLVRPGKKFTSKDTFELIKEPMPRVSRGAFKLIAAVDSWELGVKDHVCLDVGASTGGFTHVLLEREAKSVFAVDTRTNQLAQELRDDTSVTDAQRHSFKW